MLQINQAMHRIIVGLLERKKPPRCSHLVHIIGRRRRCISVRRVFIESLQTYECHNCIGKPLIQTGFSHHVRKEKYKEQVWSK